MKTPTRWRELDDPRAEPVQRLLASAELEAPVGAKARVWARLDGPRPARAGLRPLAVALAPLAALVVLAAWWFERAPSGALPVVERFGELAVDEREAGTEIPLGAAVRTGPLGRSVLAIPGVAKVELGGQTELSIHAGTTLELVTGVVRSEVEPRRPGERYVVAAGPYRVEVVGTAFTVERRGDQVAVAVEHGVVHVTGPDADGRLVAGQRLQLPRARAEAPAPSPPVAVAPPNVEPEPSRPARAPSATRRPPTVAPPAAPSSPIATPPAPRETPTAPVPGSDPRSGSAEDRDPAVATPAASEPKRAGEPPARDLSGRAEYEAARAEPDPARRLAAFDAIARGDGPFAEIAAHQAARLEVTLGQADRAALRLELLLARFPNGMLDREARISLLEARLRSGELEAAEAILGTYLARYAHEAKGAELRFLEADLARRRGRVREAMAGYQAAMDTRYGEEATYLYAYSALESGEEALGLEALRTYLARFPAGRYRAAAEARLQAGVRDR